MNFRLQDVFSRYAPAIALVASLATPALSQMTTEALPLPEWNPVDCQHLDAPLSQSDIEQREATIKALQQHIETLKGVQGAERSITELGHAKTQLGIFNLLDRFRLNLQDYTDWSELTNKLRNNGIVITSVCVRGYQYLDQPVVLHENGDGTASLDINSEALASTSASDGHTLVQITTRSLEDIAAALEPELVSRAIRFASLSGTSPDKMPLLNKSLAVEDLALILTLWQAQAAAEQVLQAADTFARTQDENAFDAVKADYPYLSDLIEDVRTKTLWASMNDETLDKEDRITFRQLAAQTMLNMPDIREQVYASLLDEMQQMADAETDLTGYFNHVMTPKEVSTAIARLDESFAGIPVVGIYSRWRDSEADPAREIIEQMELLRDSTAKNAPPSAPAP
jgi:hypothetical protein